MNNIVDPDQTKTPAIPELSAETNAMYKALKELKEDELLSYEKLRDIADEEDIRDKKRHLLTSAVRKCLNEGIVIECVFSIGMKRMTNETIDTVADHARQAIHRRSKKVKRAMKAVDYDRLNDDQKKEHCAKIAFNGAIEMFSKPSAIAKIKANQEATAKATPEPFDPAKTLKLFQ